MYAYNKDELMASRMVKNIECFQFHAFASEIIESNTDCYDLEAIEINIPKTIIQKIDKQIGLLVKTNQPNLFVTYMMDEAYLPLANIFHTDQTAHVTDVLIMGNTTGLYGRFVVKTDDSFFHYTVRLMSYA
ncbi:hypothetical protein MOW14_14825 (plasmid) [Acinetobacter indicus]|uniref:hypothetical protein n=1 Tax=Acinetobacter indicus TaxID=756892 RepID=UPI001FA6D79B|nr:hypothetical protein [Acinetobacter indicus]UNW11102.1 hypothetical protein MOW14_14825 [Acinetobacter indicus]